MKHALFAVLTALVAAAGIADAQHPPGKQGSSNMHVLAHLNDGSNYRIGDVEVEQELSRPYAYIATRKDYAGFDIISLKDPSRAFILYRWRIENPELHMGGGGQDIEYFKTHGRYYLVTAIQFQQGGPDVDLAAVVHDITGLPDTSTIKEARRFRVPDAPGGFHDVFPYKHSDGRVLLFATSGGGGRVYDLDKFLANDPNQGYITTVPVPVENAAGTRTSYHDFYVGYDPANHRDVFYGPGTGGYYVFDVTKPEEPKLLTSLTGIAGVSNGHTSTPDPTGRYAVAEAEYQYQPLRIFDLKPGLDGTVKTISRPIGAWNADWQHLAHNHEVRWPYVFVSAYEDGIQVFNMMDPTNPYTVGYYDTFDGPHGLTKGPGDVYRYAQDAPTSTYTGNWGVISGNYGVDVRNSDGLIVASDMTTGFWAIKMDGFDGWNGHQWGVPNVSSAQDWDNGPDGAKKVQKVS
ncbi:MAG: hypothetical protein HY700_08835 [Gemmatimonadetes bacterium]|nr:hypothetical protein [Gemmatimonadota bacterium]